MADDDVKIKVKVQPVLDSRATSKIIQDINKLEKNFAKIDYTKVAKQASTSVSEINRLSKDTAVFQKYLSKAAQASVENIKKLGEELRTASDEARNLEKAYASESDESKKSSIRKSYQELSRTVENLNKTLDNQKRQYSSVSKEIKGISKSANKTAKDLREFASFSGKDFAKGLNTSIRGLLSGSKGSAISGVKEVASTVGRGAAGVQSRIAMKGMQGADPSAMLNVVKSMGTAISALSGIGGALATIVVAINSASKHIADMNKNLLEGSTIAGDWKLTGKQYADTLKDFRGAANKASTELIRFGVTSESSLKNVAKFSERATGSLSRTQNIMERMGGGDLNRGVEKFTKNTLLYGKALGMETQDIAAFMGDLQSEIGVGSENIMSTMDMIMDKAKTSNMPVHKFMDIFRSAIPNLDLFTNRIEQLTGTMKLLSATMSPKSIQEFISTMSRGFDQMDFKQRLKMTAVLGPKKLNQDLQKDLLAQGQLISKEFGGVLGPELVNALKKGGGNIDAVAKVVSDAQAAGISGAAIEQAQSLARNMESAKKGGMLQTATGLRGASMALRMQSLEEYAGKFTGGDISGLGEHVAKQLGVSESEYKAILQLKDNMAVYGQNVAETGVTSSKSINDSLDALIKMDSGGTKSLKDLKEIQKNEPEKFKDYIRRAAADQMQGADDGFQSMEDIAVEQYNATTSLGDKIENVLGVYMEKIYLAMQDVVSTLGDIFNIFSTDDEAEKQSIKAQREQEAKNKEQRIKSAEDAKSVLMGSGHEYAKNLSGGKLSGKMERQYTDQAKKLVSARMTSGGIKDALAPILQAASSLSPDDIKNLGIGSKVQSDRLISTAQNDPDKIPEELANILGRGGPQEMEKISKLLAVLSAKGIEIQDPTETPKMLTRAETRTAQLASDSDIRFIKGTQEARAGRGAAPATGPGVSFQEEQVKTQTEQAKTAEDTLKVQEKSAQVQEETKDNLKKGVKIEPSFLNSQYKNVVKDSTLDAFRTALIEFAILQARLSEGGQFKTDFMTNIEKIGDSGASALPGLVGGDVNKFLRDTPGYADGGPINYDQLAKVHSGEFVVPRGGALIREGSGSGTSKSVTVNATINANTNASPQQIANAVHDLYRHH